MIGRVLPRGTRVGGLVRYLYGPGKAEEHTNPHIVASWTGETASLEPKITERNQRDYRTLVGLLEANVQATPDWQRMPEPVYHVAVRNDASDRVLSDDEWAAVATQIMDSTGLARQGDDAGVRWIAVRHADDHIHIVATLARADARPPRRSNDFHRIRETCRYFERRYGLVETADADQTAARRPSRAEQEKARRASWHMTAREKLRREVRSALSGAANEEEFFARLRGAGVMVRLRHSTANPLEVTGYAIGLPDAKTAAGTTVWYGGGRLAADLTLPKIRQRWTQDVPKPTVAGETPKATETPTEKPTTSESAKPKAKQSSQQERPRISPEERRRVLDDAARIVAEAARDIRRLVAENPEEASAVAYAASDMMSSAARVVEGARGGPLTQAAEAFDHASRHRYGRVHTSGHSRSPRSEQLRSSARLLAAVRRVRPNDEAVRVAELVTQLAALADTVAELRSSQRRLAQAGAARQAAAMLRAEAETYTAVIVAPSAPRRAAGPTGAPRRRPGNRPSGPAPGRG